MLGVLIRVMLGISVALIPTKAAAAQRIAFDLFPFGQFYIQIDDLEAFVERGEVSSELAYYLNRLPPKQVEALPELLSTPLELNPLTIAKFSNSTIGETVIRNFGKAIRNDTKRNGFLALRSAIIAAAFEKQGLTITNLLSQFPGETIYVDLKVIERYIKLGEKLFKDRQAIDNLFFTNPPPAEDSEIVPSYLAKSGQYMWQKKTLTYKNPRRNRPGNFDLYLPQIERASLIVISHGVASSRDTFDYLGQHLSSHGFAVAIVEHDDISLNKFDNFLSGLERFPEPNNLIDQPLDVSSVLDKLERETKTDRLLQNKIDLQQVGIIGHSFGGYTSLALAGGKLIADPNAPKCQIEDYQNILLDLSSLAKCTFNEISEVDYRLKDPRIKAVMAINPMAKIFDKEGMAAINIPTMIVSGTNDLMMPSVPEQILPFSWLNPNIEKHLVLVKPGTHFSFLREGLGVLPVPDTVVGIRPTLAYPTIKSLSITFFKAHLEKNITYQKYLRSDRFDLEENNTFDLSIVRSISPTKLQQLINY